MSRKTNIFFFFLLLGGIIHTKDTPDNCFNSITFPVSIVFMVRFICEAIRLKNNCL